MVIPSNPATSRTMMACRQADRITINVASIVYVRNSYHRHRS
jgi:hypothetical protein